MPLAERFVAQATGPFWVPIVQRAEDGKDQAADKDIVKVRNHKVGIAQLPIKRSGCQHNSSEAGDEKLENEGNAEQHRSVETNFATPHCPQPVEDFDPS